MSGIEKKGPPTVFVGIDPGKSGAVGVIYTDQSVFAKAGGYKPDAEAWHNPLVIERKTTSAKLKSGKRKGQNVKRRTEKRHIDLAGRLRLLLPFARLHKTTEANVLVTLEQVSSGPRDGKVQAFSFGYDYGSWEMALVALGIPYTTVRPHVWRPEMVGVAATKKDSLKLCRRLYPKVDLPLEKDEARAEALLLADWQRRRAQKLSMPHHRKSEKQEKKDE